MSRPYIIAEIGQNHQGDAYLALRLVKAAIDAGADCVKFQLRNRHEEYTAEELAKPHPMPDHAFGETYGEHRAALDLTVAALVHIKKRMQYNQWSIDMAITPCHVSCVDPLVQFEMPFWKIASKDCGNVELMEAIQRVGGNMWISTGGAGSPEVSASAPYADVLLHCVPEYPCPLDHADLRRLNFLAEYGKRLGWSDHTGQPYLGAAAVVLGAEVFEAHITFSKQMKGRDHLASLEPHEFRRWADGIRAAWWATGSGWTNERLATLAGT